MKLAALQKQIASVVMTPLTPSERMRRTASNGKSIVNVAKKFIKPIPHDELRREIDLFCELFARPAVMAALKKFVEATDAMPYLP